jgi:hypothetical protein
LTLEEVPGRERRLAMGGRAKVKGPAPSGGLSSAWSLSLLGGASVSVVKTLAICRDVLAAARRPSNEMPSIAAACRRTAWSASDYPSWRSTAMLSPFEGVESRLWLLRRFRGGWAARAAEEGAEGAEAAMFPPLRLQAPPIR